MRQNIAHGYPAHCVSACHLTLNLCHYIVNGLHRWILQFINELAISKENNTIGVRRRLSIVRHNDHSLVILVHRSAQNIQYLGRRIGIQVTRRLIAKNNLRPRH